MPEQRDSRWILLVQPKWPGDGYWRTATNPRSDREITEKRWRKQVRDFGYSSVSYCNFYAFSSPDENQVHSYLKDEFAWQNTSGYWETEQESKEEAVYCDSTSRVGYPLLAIKRSH